MLNIRVFTPYIQINKKTIQTFQKTDVCGTEKLSFILTANVIQKKVTIILKFSFHHDQRCRDRKNRISFPQ